MKHSIVYTPFPLNSFRDVNGLYTEYENELDAYANKLLWWNAKVNLVSRDVSRETLIDHIKHSLTPFVLSGFKKASSIVDTGTGGGLPGLPLAITHRDKTFLLNDIVQKKINTINQIKRELGLANVKTKACSISEIPVEDFDLIISKHAFKINDLIVYLGERDWKEVILLKGKSFEGELEGLETPLDIQVFDLFEESRNPFYNGKAILSIKKQEPHEE